MSPALKGYSAAPPLQRRRPYTISDPVVQGRGLRSTRPLQGGRIRKQTAHAFTWAVLTK
jgi:hypothetical protein